METNEKPMVVVDEGNASCGVFCEVAKRMTEKKSVEGMTACGCLGCFCHTEGLKWRKATKEEEERFWGWINSEADKVAYEIEHNL